MTAMFSLPCWRSHLAMRSAPALVWKKTMVLSFPIFPILCQQIELPHGIDRVEAVYGFGGGDADIDVDLYGLYVVKSARL